MSKYARTWFSKCLELLGSKTAHDVVEVGGQSTLRVDGENHRLRVERGGQPELNVAEVLEEELGDVGGLALESLDLLLGGVLLAKLQDNSVHVILDPGLEIVGSTDLSLGVLEAVDDVVDGLGRAVNSAILLARTAEGVTASNINVISILDDVLGLAVHQTLNL